MMARLRQRHAVGVLGSGRQQANVKNARIDSAKKKPDLPSVKLWHVITIK
jgi:hypothetical protein